MKPSPLPALSLAARSMIEHMAEARRAMDAAEKAIRAGSTAGVEHLLNVVHDRATTTATLARHGVETITRTSRYRGGKSRI